LGRQSDSSIKPQSNLFDNLMFVANKPLKAEATLSYIPPSLLHTQQVTSVTILNNYPDYLSYHLSRVAVLSNTSIVVLPSVATSDSDSFGRKHTFAAHWLDSVDPN
jgi:hypothetical protein